MCKRSHFCPCVAEYLSMNTDQNFQMKIIVVLIFKLRPWTFNVKNLRHIFHDVFMSQEFGFRFGKCTIVNCSCA